MYQLDSLPVTELISYQTVTHILYHTGWCWSPRISWSWWSSRCSWWTWCSWPSWFSWCCCKCPWHLHTQDSGIIIWTTPLTKVFFVLGKPRNWWSTWCQGRHCKYSWWSICFSVVLYTSQYNLPTILLYHPLITLIFTYIFQICSCSY